MIALQPMPYDFTCPNTLFGNALTSLSTHISYLNKIATFLPYMKGNILFVNKCTYTYGCLYLNKKSLNDDSYLSFFLVMELAHEFVLFTEA